MIAVIGKITYSYTPENWSQEEFLRLGGFTIVFLNYNTGWFLEKSVPSALNQDFPQLEMFFMDDASPDGSGDVLERIVRGYRGRHKVTVVRNDENQYITGQWNIVAKLASGNWLGMFCGDDVAYPDRVSRVAEQISLHPTIRGICTSADEVVRNKLTGEGVPVSKPQYTRPSYLAPGNSTDVYQYFCYGCTAFWHKSLFVDPLPKVPFDDGYLHLRTFILNRRSQDPVFFYAGKLKTIEYSVGIGVCGEGVELPTSGTHEIRRWYLETSRFCKFLKGALATFSAALAYADEKQVDASFKDPFVRPMWNMRIESASPFERFALLPALVSFMADRKVEHKKKVGLWRTYWHMTLSRSFGLWVPAIMRFVVAKLRNGMYR